MLATRSLLLSLVLSMYYLHIILVYTVTAWILYTVVTFVIGLALMALISIPSIFGYYYYRLVYVEKYYIIIFLKLFITVLLLAGFHSFLVHK